MGWMTGMDGWIGWIDEWYGWMNGMEGRMVWIKEWGGWMDRKLGSMDEWIVWMEEGIPYGTDAINHNLVWFLPMIKSICSKHNGELILMGRGIHPAWFPFIPVMISRLKANNPLWEVFPNIKGKINLKQIHAISKPSVIYSYAIRNKLVDCS